MAAGLTDHVCRVANGDADMSSTLGDSGESDVLDDFGPVLDQLGPDRFGDRDRRNLDHPTWSQVHGLDGRFSRKSGPGASASREPRTRFMTAS
jgi:hypothetical protein